MRCEAFDHVLKSQFEITSCEFNWFHMERHTPIWARSYSWRIRLKTKVWGQKNCLQSTDWIVLRHRFGKGYRDGSQENDALHYSEMEDVWNKQDSSERCSSDQTEQLEGKRKGLEMCPRTQLSLWHHRKKKKEKKISHTVSIMFGGNQALHMTCPTPSLQWSMVGPSYGDLNSSNLLRWPEKAQSAGLKLFFLPKTPLELNATMLTASDRLHAY